MAVGERGFQRVMTGIVLHWRKRAIYGDLARGSCGLLLCAVLLSSFSMMSLGQFAFAGLCALFGSFVAGSGLKLASAVAISDEAVRLSRPLLGPKLIKWANVRSFEVRYFSIGQVRKQALMDLKVSDGQTSIVLDDGLEDFPAAARQCWLSARAHGVAISERTMANLAAAGCATDVAQQNG